MKRTDISRALSDISDQYIKEAAEEPRGKKPVWGRVIAVAACLVLTLFAVEVPSLFSPRTEHPTTLFSLSAYASDNTSSRLDFEQSVRSSVGDVGNIFGVDMPMFNLSVEPKGGSDIFYQYQVELSYKGSTVTGKDKHVMVAAQVPAKGYEGVCQYVITGWFTEPTDLTITVKEKESDRVVEAHTVHIRYLPEKREYELTVTEVYCTADYDRLYGYALYDIDGDGIEEMCRLGRGFTSGVFSFTLTVYEGEKVEYENSYVSKFYELSLIRDKAGRLQVQGITQQEPPVTHVFDLILRDGGVYLVEGDLVIEPLKRDK